VTFIPLATQVYELRDASWFDRGTGSCRGFYDSLENIAYVIVEAETPPDVAPKTPPGGFVKEAELLLKSRVERDDIYARQQGMIGIDQY
jgi:protein phosphatase-4 regulatory subunit 3